MGGLLYNTFSLQDMNKRVFELDQEHKMYLNLFEGIKNISLAENIDEAITIFYRTIKDSYGINTANILITDPGTGGYKVFKSLGLSKETDNNFKITEDEAAFNNIMELGEPMFISDFKEMDIYKKGISEADKKKIKLLYSVPIKTGNKSFGYFNIFNLGDDFSGELSRIQERVFSLLPFGLLSYIINESK